MKRKQKGPTLPIMLAVILLFFVIAAIAVNTQSKREQEDALLNAAPEVFTICSIAAEDITAVSWENGGDGISLAKGEGRWELAETPAFPLNQEYVNQLLTALSGLSSTVREDDVLEPERYGLDNPTVITLTTASGEQVYHLGPQLPEAGGWYISDPEEPQTAYLIDKLLPEQINRSLLDWAVQDKINQIGDPTVISLTSGGKTTAYVQANGKWTKSGNSVDSAKLDQLLAVLAEMKWAQTVAFAPSDDEASEFGLLQPVNLLSVTYSELAKLATGAMDAAGNAVVEEKNHLGVLEIHIGNAAPEGGYYASLPNSPLVYLLDADTVNAIVAIK